MRRRLNIAAGIRSQRGSATLVVSVALLLAVTVMVFFIARTNLLEQRIAANDYRGQQAYEAAEAGLEYAIGRMNATSPVILDSAATFADAGFGCNPANTPITGECLTDTPLDNGATFKVSLTEIGTDFIDVRITAKGYSDDQSAMREVTMQVSRVALVGNPPPYPLVAKEEVDLDGSATVNSPLPVATRRCIWSGKSAGPAAATNCTSLADGEDDLEDASENEFFENFFLLGRERIKEQITVEPVAGQGHAITRTSNGGTDYSAALIAAYNPPGSVRIFWIDGEDNDVVIDISGGDLGTAADPVVLIIDNFTDLTITGGAARTIHGLVYIAGDWDNGASTATINGIVIAEGDVELGGSFRIDYGTGGGDPVIDRIRNIGRYARIPGSWRDF